MSEDKSQSAVTTQGEEFRKISNQAPADAQAMTQVLTAPVDRPFEPQLH